MINPHPPLTAFPVALITTVCALECVAFFFKAKPEQQKLQVALRINLLLAGLAVIAAFFSGYFAQDSASLSFTVPQQAIELHQTLARILLFSIIPCVALRFIADRASYQRRYFVLCYYILLAICLVLVVAVGYRGGQLVFKHGAGVRIDQQG